MAVLHKVVQGEHISGIAKEYGFTDYLPVWVHPKNARLRNLRKDPNILLPGDMVFVPDLGKKTLPRPTEKRHKFLLRGTQLMLRIKLGHAYAQPMKNAPCDLLIDSEQKKLRTDGDGKLAEKISKSAKDALLMVKESVQIKGKPAQLRFKIATRIGHLNPLDEPSGQIVRLANLGYYRLDGEVVDNAEFLSAVEEFQCENGLTVDGVCGPVTQAKLKAVYGC
jgi:hypothetical protein